ncbi:MAG TPA: TraB/GumN family protein, partial [Chitinophagaceae bacterium]|nr:TraB/GumN family protein [Chitinophagaceae bacterium]
KGLETTEYQAGLFDSIPYANQARELVNYIDSIDTYKKNAAELLTVYKKQDLKKMEHLTTKSDPGMEKYLDLLIYNRNRHWMQQLAFILRTEPTLVAVGAGHLPGEDGMLSLLKKSGFAVKPIPNVVPTSK